jgi:hypothetical protein
MMNPPELVISIPTIELTCIDDVIRCIKAALVYLETPECRSCISETQRLHERRMVTEQFRKAIKMRHDEIERNKEINLYD